MINKAKTIYKKTKAKSLSSNSTVNLNQVTSGSSNRISHKEYDLYMRFDTNTNGHMQWYYFSVKNTKKMKVKFNIYRFRKRYSLYQRGMKPYTKSLRSGKGWVGACQKVNYFKEKVYSQQPINEYTQYYYLSFYYEFQHENDQVYFAACIPYTTTYLKNQLQIFKAINVYNSSIKIQVSNLCYSLCGQEIDLVTIQPRIQNKSKVKQFIVINTRSHSGQSSGSWVLDGFMEYVLINEDIQAWMLNMNICFKIVPILNKDGVFIGNYRTGIIGDDFNRQFSSGSKEYFPQIIGLKVLVSNCSKEGKIRLFLDLHGHSILRNSFIFGPDKLSFEKNDLIKLGQHLFHSSKYFSARSSKYQNQKNKIETARVFFQYHHNILSLTCQNSLGLHYFNYETYQSTQHDWRIFGQNIAQSMKEIMISHPIQENVRKNEAFERHNKGSRYFQSKRREHYNVMTKNKAGNLQISQRNNIQNASSKNQRGNKQTNPKKFYQKDSEKMRRISISSRQSRRQNNTGQRQKAEIDLNQSIKYQQYQQQELSQNNNSTLRQRQKKDEKNIQITQNSIKEDIQIGTQQNISLDNSLSEQNEQQQILNQNFSEEYQSINDQDSQADDLQPQQKQQLFKKIKEIKYIKDSDYSNINNTSKYLQPLKTFKQYKFNSEEMNATAIMDKKKITQLKPIKYQQLKLKKLAERRARPAIAMKPDLNLNMNTSSIDSPNQQQQFLKNKFFSQFTYRQKEKSISKETINKEDHYLKETNNLKDYMIMRIKQIKIQKQKKH